MEPSGIHGFDLVGVMVRDANKAIAFYKNVLGLEPTEEFPNGAEFQLADGAFFGVWQPPDGEEHSGWEVMFGVQDINAALKAMRERGAELSDPVETNVCFMAFGKDPDGNRFIIHERKSSA